MLNRRYDDAISEYREMQELDPYFYKSYTSMGRVYIQKGMYDEAIALLQKGRSLAGEVPTILGALGQALALSGKRSEARQLLHQLQELSQHRYVACSSFALIHTGLGEKERALEILEAGCEQRQSVLVALNVHPAYDDLRGEPRFNAILKRIGFNPD
jgi:serine/threonine-protein kinase